MKPVKNKLKKDTVQSTHFHVGIELELIAKSDGYSEHDHDSCLENRESYLRDEGAESTLRNEFNVPRGEANALANYFNFDEWIEDQMSNWSCEDDDCNYNCYNSDSIRESLQEGLLGLTSNTSFKVVPDSSINHDNTETDAEVCWNYFASKETLKDNEKILKYLKKEKLHFNTSCGLHINLNNYLKLPEMQAIPTDKLSFLFNFVGDSRKNSSYCNRCALSTSEKYSMIYHQGDRLEFRFFSPTLESEKLNNYVSLANLVYRRLCGQDAKLSKKVQEYFINKLVHVNELSREDALDSINKVNSILSYNEYVGKARPTNEKQVKLIETPQYLPNEEEEQTIAMIDCLDNHAPECACVRDGQIIISESEAI